jgi:hypothetical protein
MRLIPHPGRSTTPHRSPRRGPLAGRSAATGRVQLSTPRPSRSTTHRSAAPAMSAASGRHHPSTWRLLVVIELAVLAVLVNASTAHAETTQVLALVGSIDQVLTNIRTWVMGILASLATVFLSIGGVRYVMGGGNPGEIEKAKTAFKSAAIGYGLAALAPLVVTVLQGIVGA